MKVGQNSKRLNGKQCDRDYGRVWHCQIANVNDTLKEHCVRSLINHGQPSLIIYDRREKRRGRKEKRKREHSVTGHTEKHKVPYN